MHTHMLCCEIQNAYFTIVFTFMITIIWIHFHNVIGPGREFKTMISYCSHCILQRVYFSRNSANSLRSRSIEEATQWVLHIDHHVHSVYEISQKTHTHQNYHHNARVTKAYDQQNFQMMLWWCDMIIKFPETESWGRRMLMLNYARIPLQLWSIHSWLAIKAINLWNIKIYTPLNYFSLRKEWQLTCQLQVKISAVCISFKPRFGSMSYRKWLRLVSRAVTFQEGRSGSGNESRKPRVTNSSMIPRLFKQRFEHRLDVL